MSLGCTVRSAEMTKVRQKLVIDPFLAQSVSNNLNIHYCSKEKCTCATGEVAIWLVTKMSRINGISRASFYMHREEGPERLCGSSKLDRRVKTFLLFLTLPSPTQTLPLGAARPAEAVSGSVFTLVYRPDQGKPR